MGRPERPVTTSNKALAELVSWMREQRTLAGRSYRELATRTKCTATTLQRAASGDSVPRLGTVLSYARACDASLETAKMFWKAARYEEATQGSRVVPPRPALIWDTADLGVALVDLYRRAGSPSLRSMEERAGGYGVLPRSAAHRIVTRQTIPLNPRQFKGFLTACDVPEGEQETWIAAWSRAARLEKQENADAALSAVALQWDADIVVDSVTYEVKHYESPWFQTAPVPAARADAIRRRLRQGGTRHHEPTNSHFT